jgi:allophanate hydrolase
LNNIVGFKPTPGSVPMQGVLPACRTLDVVSVFALSTDDAAQVLALMQGAAGEPAFHPVVLQPAWLGTCSRRLRIGVPAAHGCDAALGYAAAFEAAVAQLGTLDVDVVPLDMGTLHQVARLLYDGPWVAERYAVVKGLLEHHRQALDPVVADVIARATAFDAGQAFEARYELAALAQTAQAIWSTVDALMVPTTPTCPRFDALAEQPILRNSELGTYTNFVNLLGWSALSLPASISHSGLPFGVTFIGPAGADAALADWGRRWERATDLPAGRDLAPLRREPISSTKALAAEPSLTLAVVGAHLQGLPLHGQLVERRCRLLQRTHTAPHYRLYALAGTQPAKPGLVRHASDGAAIAVEVYEMPLSAVGSFLQAIPYPLGLGNLELQDGRWVKGFICEPAGLAGAQDITAHGGWQAFLAQEALAHAPR